MPTVDLSVLTDWNDALTFVHRRDVNYFVPCYFMAFPPYNFPSSAGTCPVAEYLSPQQQLRPGGPYDWLVGWFEWAVFWLVGYLNRCDSTLVVEGKGVKRT